MDSKSVKRFITALLFITGISFAVTAKDFPCISKPEIHKSENGSASKCWTFVADKRDGQKYLAIKRCNSTESFCHLEYIENSRFKSSNAVCPDSLNIYYGCVYPTNEEAAKYACPDFGVPSECHGLSSEFFGQVMTYDSYVKFRKDISDGKKVNLNALIDFTKVIIEEQTASEIIHAANPCGSYQWIKANGKWGVGGHAKFSNNYWSCSYKIPKE